MNRKLILANGREFSGQGFGACHDSIAELVFNTAMVGYQEVITDPSYTTQMVVMTYPLIGNYGITEEDNESKTSAMGGLIVREYQDKPSNFRYTKTLAEVLEEYGVPGIAQIDTRLLTRIIREEGSMPALITDEGTTLAEGLARLRAYEPMKHPVSQVSCKKSWYSRTANPRCHVVAVDCGIKYNIIRQLNQKGCNVTIVPYNTDYETILNMKPDGVFISNGPGDPTENKEVIALIRHLQGKLPIFGICLGHQLIALANGCSTYKMKFGHRGGNHPVKHLLTNRIEMTSQNHSYAVDAHQSKENKLEFTHVNLLDHTVEGLRVASEYLFSVQYHPESNPGPQDSTYLFDQFIAYMKAFAKGEAIHA